MGNVYIGSVATALPAYIVDQTGAEAFLRKHYSSKLNRRNLKLMKTIFSHQSIRKRHFAIDDPEQLIDEDHDKRIQQFAESGIRLSTQAIIDALSKSGLSASDVSGLIVNTCTGYICPGISTYIIERLGLSHSIKTYDLVGSGCGGAIPNIQIAQSILNDMEDGVILSVSVEICSSTFQMEDDLGLIISNAIFGDGAAAALLWKRHRGLKIMSTSSRLFPEFRESIRYIHRNGQLHNQLSLSLHEHIKRPIREVVMDLLKPMSLSASDIKYWALHPGGSKIIDSVQEELRLSEEQLSATRHILSSYGNMSSPTVLFVLREIIDRGISDGQWCVMLGFGAGLSAHGLLLKT